MPEITVKVSKKEARELRYFLRQYFNTKAELPTLIKRAAVRCAGWQACKEADDAKAALNKTED